MPHTQLEWLSDGILQEVKLNREARRVELVRVDPKTGKTEPLLESRKIEEALNSGAKVQVESEQGPHSFDGYSLRKR